MKFQNFVQKCKKNKKIYIDPEKLFGIKKDMPPLFFLDTSLNRPIHNFQLLLLCKINDLDIFKWYIFFIAKY